jgi:hypothetical protein
MANPGAGLFSQKTCNIDGCSTHHRRTSIAHNISSCGARGLQYARCTVSMIWPAEAPVAPGSRQRRIRASHRVRPARRGWSMVLAQLQLPTLRHWPPRA